ncbi:MAG: hypothetical protein ACPGRC_00720 [Salibacteraceae bacterium]
MRKFSIGFVALTTLFLGIVACQKDTLVTDVVHNEDPDYDWGKGDSIPILTDFYFEGKIDSVKYTLQDSINGFYNLVFDSTFSSCSDTTTFYGQLTGMYTLGLNNSLEIKFLKCVKDPTDDSDKKSLIYSGTYPYGSSKPFNFADGVEVSWVDNSGKVWKSLPGSGSSNNDSFVILGISPNPGNGLGESLIEGTMDMHLYNQTQSIRIEGGQFKFQYGVY